MLQPGSTWAGAGERVRFLVSSDEDPLADDGPDVVRNLCRQPKKISSVYVYDAVGTAAFEEQCRTPEYYLRRAETLLLKEHARDIVELSAFPSIVELGAGSAEKTRILMAQYDELGLRCDYFPIDVDTETLRGAAVDLTAMFPRLVVHCLGTTYEAALRALPERSSHRLFLFLGGSIGNMEAGEIDALLTNLFAASRRGDYLLLGADLDKDPAIIDRAYNDAAGWGARSTLNMLSHLNRRFDGDFRLHQFRYRSKYDFAARTNRVHIESLVNQQVTLARLNFTFELRASELIDAEVMLKFDPQELDGRLDRSGFQPVCRWIEPSLVYGLFLCRRR